VHRGNPIINKYLKVLHVSTSFGKSSAGYRLHEALLQEKEIDSFCFVENTSLDDIRIIKYYENIITRIKKTFFIKVENIIINKLYKNRINLPFSLALFSSKKLVRQINNINPDIVHLHWICGGFMKIDDISKIKSPIVLSLHDQWGYTGGCHIVAELVPKFNSECCYNVDEMCNKYTENCGTCGVLRSKKKKDLSFYILQKKKKIFSRIKSMTIVGVSKWMTDCAGESTVFKGKKIFFLPNPINTNVFKRIDKIQSRILWNLPVNKKLILFGAKNATSTPYKGYKLLMEALNKISSENIECVVFGSNKPKNIKKNPYEIHYIGYLNDVESLVTLYNACDVMVHPSMREAFGLTAAESLSCGTPVIAFGHSGLLDIIDHKKNGYLAEPFDTTDLANGIDWVLNNENYDELSKNAREKVVREFDYDIVAKKYITLYQTIFQYQDEQQ